MDEQDVATPIRIRLVQRTDFYPSRKESVVEIVGVGAEQMDRADAVRLFVAPPSLPEIQKNFAMIHQQHHEKLMELLLDEFLDSDGDSDSEREHDGGLGLQYS